MAAATLKHWIYKLGVLSWWHRLRNRGTLTVVIFHQVAPVPPGEAWPPWTVPPQFFEQCLRFFRKHYTPVGLSEVLEAVTEGGKPLPPRALLVTFDDGWANNFEVAQPILQRLEIPAVLFTVAGIENGRQCWQEPLLQAYFAGGFDDSQRAAIWRRLGEPSAADVNRLLARLENLPPSRRQELLSAAGIELSAAPSSPVMWTASQLEAWASTNGLAIGSHGLTHHPLTLVADAKGEAAQSRTRLEAILSKTRHGLVESISAPHGLYDDRVLDACASAGYRTVFTSDAILNVVEGGRPSNLLGRVEPAVPYFADSRGNLIPYRLAALLFFLPKRNLTPFAPKRS